MVWVAGIKRWYMMMDTNEHGDFPEQERKQKTMLEREQKKV